jgi:hypothetical protein
MKYVGGKTIKAETLKSNGDADLDLIADSYLSDNVSLSFFCFSRIESLLSKEYRWVYESRDKDRLKIENEEAEYVNPFEVLGQMRESFDFLKTAIPYDVFLYGEDLFIPINENHLRGDKNKIGFSFERKMNIVGRVNKRIQEKYEEKHLIIQTLNKMQNVVFFKVGGVWVH